MSKKRQMTGALTLLEKAMGIETRKNLTEGIGNEHYELASGWMNGVVSNAQVAKALGLTSVDELGVESTDYQSAVMRMAVWLRDGVKRKKITVVAA